MTSFQKLRTVFVCVITQRALVSELNVTSSEPSARVPNSQRTAECATSRVPCAPPRWTHTRPTSGAATALMCSSGRVKTWSAIVGAEAFAREAVNTDQGRSVPWR